MPLKRTEWAVLAFNVLYVAGFLAYFILIANREFIGYIATMAGLVALIAWMHREVRFPIAMLWAFSLWGLAHMAGGGLAVGQGVLYNLVLVHLAGSGELAVLKYDQVVHFYGFAVTAWLLWYLLDSQHPALRGSRAILVFPALASMGLGALKEIVEFSAVLLVPDTNVGGYLNTGLDLVSNALGAVFAMALIAWRGRRRG